MNAPVSLALALALALLGGRAAAAEIDAALAFLRSSQRADGSWPAACGLEVEAATTSVRAFAGAGQAASPTVARALAFLAALPEPVPNHHLALRALARLDAGRDARADLDRLLAVMKRGYNPPGGWGLSPGDPAETIATALALEALASHPDHADRAELIFPFWTLRRACARIPVLFAADPASREPEGSLHVSAFGIVAFHLLRVRYHAVESLTWAVDAARERQDAAGGYGDTGATALETALVLHATKTARVLLGEHETRAAEFLRTRQGPDGSWDGDALATAWAVRALSIPLDTDGDGMTDAWEAAHGLDLADRRDATSDVDGDGLAALVEFRAGSDPRAADSDGDGLDDGAESQHGSDPADPASRNRPPAFVSTPGTFAALGAAYRYAARAVDPDGDAVTYRLAHGPAGLAVDAAGTVAWASPAAGVFPVAIAALDGRGGSAVQSYVLEARVQGVDLYPALVDLRGLIVDPQSLSSLGTVAVEVANGGPASFQGSFAVTVFIDANGTRAFEPAADPIAGRAGFTGAIAAGGKAVISVPASAAQTFRDAPLLAWADSGQAVRELDESNNMLSSSAASQFAGDLSRMWPVIEWWWKETDPPDFNSRVALPPVVANLTDDNGDERIDERDVPDVIFVAASHQGFEGYLRAVSGDTGRLLWSWPGEGPPIAQPGVLKSIAVGDLEGDGAPEVVVTAGFPSLHMVCIDSGGAEKWRRGSLPLYFNTGSFVLADLEGDGTLEILSGANVFDHQGRHLWEAPYPTYGGLFTGILSLPLALDLDLDGRLEVVLGMSAHDLTGTQLWDWQTEGRESSGFTATFRRAGQVVRSFPVPLSDFRGDAHTAAIQADDDPEPEILCVGWADPGVGMQRLPFWMLEPDGEVRLGPVHVPLAAPERHQLLGSSSPLVADLDGDGRQDFIIVVESTGSQFVSPKQVGVTMLFAFARDGRLLWNAQFNSNSAAHTPSVPVACDLEGDGRLEIVLQTVHQLHLLEGRTGKSLWSFHADAFFRIMGPPAIADADNDGNLEIIGFATDQYTFGTPLNRGVYAIGDAADQWGNARRSWNQHRHLPAALGEDGRAAPNADWNRAVIGAERIQVPIAGHGPQDAPDLTVARLRNDPAACPQVVLVARVGNAGSLHVPAGVPVEFWHGDPGAGGARIGVAATARALEPGEHEEVRLAWPSAPPAGAAVHAWVSPQRPWKTVRSNDLVSELNARAPLAYADGSSQNTHGWGIFTWFALQGSGWTDQGSFDLEWLPHRFFELGFAIPVTIESVTLTNSSFPAAGWRTADFLLWREADAVPSVALPVEFGSSSVTVDVPDAAGVRRLRFQGNDVASHAAVQSLAVAGSFEDPYRSPAEGIYPRLNEGRGDNNRVQASLTWTCAGNAAPAITSAPPLLARPGESYRYELVAEDPNGDLVTFEVLSGPSGLELLSPFGPLAWTPLAAQIGEHAVRVRARDPSGAAVEQAWRIAVVNAIAGENRAPRITSEAPFAATGTAWTHAFAASDPDGDALLWLLVSGAPGMALDPRSGELAWPPAAGAFTVAVRVEDGRGGSDEQRFTLVAGDSEAPLPVEPVDADGDGHFVPADCDDANAQVHPAMAEIPGNGIDDDCNAGTPDATASAAVSVLVRPARGRYARGDEVALLARAEHTGAGGAIAGLRLELEIAGPRGEMLHADAAPPRTLLPGGRSEWTFRARSDEWPVGRLTARVAAIAGSLRAGAEASFTLTPGPGSFRRGDANADGRFNISDPLRTLGYLFIGGTGDRVPCLDAADADDSGAVNITDPINTLNHLFQGGRPPPAPGPAVCGDDPTADVLPPCEYPGGACVG